MAKVEKNHERLTEDGRVKPLKKSKLKTTNTKCGRKGTHPSDDGVGKIQVGTSWLNLTKL